MLNLKSDQAKKREAQTQLRLIQSVERRMHGALAREIRRAVELAASSYPNWRPTLSQHRRNLAMILERFGSETALASAQRTMGTFKKACPWSLEKKLDTNKSLTQRIMDWALGNATKAKGISDTTKERIGNSIAYSIGKNESPAEISERIVSQVGGMSSARAFMIARTESHMAHNVGQQYSTESAEKEFNLKLTKTWVATEDARTRETHTKADGQTVPLKKKFHVGKSWLMFPGDPNGPPGEVINCYLPGTVVSGTFFAGSKSAYSGPAREIVTKRGLRLSVTPNHPILSTTGWLAASQFKKGDNLFGYINNISDTVLGNPDNQNAPTKIEEAFDLIRSNGRSRLSVIGALDFNGDSHGITGEVEIAAINGELLDKRYSEPENLAADFTLPFSDTAQVSMHRDSPLNFSASIISTSSPLFIGRDNLPLACGAVHPRPFNQFSLGLTSSYDAGLIKPTPHDIPRHAKFISDLILTYAGAICFDEIVSVRDFNFVGHVYDLQSTTGWMIAQGIVASNCRCVPVYNS